MCVWSNIAYITHVYECVCPSANARSQPVLFLAASACVSWLVSEVDTFFPTPMSALKITNWLENLMKVVAAHLAPNFSSFPSPISSTLSPHPIRANGWWLSMINSKSKNSFLWSIYLLFKCLAWEIIPVTACQSWKEDIILTTVDRCSIPL